MSSTKYTNKIQDSNNFGLQKRLLVGTPTLGSIRMEWAAARYGQIIPSNWSKVDMIQYLNSFIPMRYSVADAQNLIVQEAINRGYEWVLFLEDDTIPPPDAFVRFNDYMNKGDIPVVSGLYYTRSVPAEPMVYRGRGNSYFTDWKLGDKVWVDGVPTGMLLVDMRLMKIVYDDSPEYQFNGIQARRVFETPGKTWFNEETGAQEMLVGTSDLDWCKRVIENGYLKKHWPNLARKKYPFLIDTNIPCMHIDRGDGTQFPVEGIHAWCAARGMVK
jgi:hypothetical protein